MELRYPSISSSVSSVPRMLLTLATRAAVNGCSGVLPATSTWPGQIVAPVSEISSQNRSMARSMLSPQSQPRRKRVDASLGRFKRLTVREIDGGSHQAISRSTEVVVSVTSVLRPPITPESETTSSESLAMTPSVEMRVRSASSRVTSVSPSVARRTESLPFGTVSRSKTWLGWPYSSIT